VVRTAIEETMSITAFLGHETRKRIFTNCSGIPSNRLEMKLIQRIWCIISTNIVTNLKITELVLVIASAKLYKLIL